MGCVKTIKLDNEYAIVADTYNVILKRTYKPTHKPVRGEQRDIAEDVIGYYSSITSAVMAYRKEKVKTWVAGEIMTLDALLDRIEALDKTMTKRLSGYDAPLLDVTHDMDDKLKAERTAAKQAVKDAKRNGAVKANG